MRLAPQRGAAVLAVVLLAVPALLPLLSAATAWAVPAGEVWQHQLAHVLPRVAANTVLLLALVAVATTVLGTGLAWLVAGHAFPGATCSRGRCCCRSPCRATCSRSYSPVRSISPGRCRAGCANRSTPACACHRSVRSVVPRWSCRCAVPVRVHAGAGRIRNDGGTHPGGGADPRPRPPHGLPSRAAAAGAAGDRRRRRPGVHGDAGGLRCRGGAQRGHLHDLDLPRVVRHVLDRRRAADGRGARVRGAGRRLARAQASRRARLRR